MTQSSSDAADLDLEALCVAAARALLERHRRWLRPGEQIQVACDVHEGHRRVALVLRDPAQDAQLELFAEVPDLDDSAAIELGLDFLDGVLAEILRGGREAFPPLDPAPYRFEGQTVLLSGGLRRPDLEAQADALLAGAGTTTPTD